MKTMRKNGRDQPLSNLATVTARALRGKREKSLVPWSPRKHIIKEEKTHVERGGDFSVGRIS